MKRLLISLPVVLLLASAVPALAQIPWSLVLTDPIQCGPAGSTLTFHGTIDNYVDRGLSGVVWSSWGQNSEGGFGLPLAYGNPTFADELLAWLEPDLELPALGHYEGALLRVAWSDIVPDGFWQEGTFGGSFEGYAITRDLQASVCGAPPVPEPASLALLASGLLGLFLLRKRR